MNASKEDRALAPQAISLGGAPQACLKVEQTSYAYAATDRSAPEFTLGPVSFEAKEHALVAILGPNASGKSTLLKLLAGLEGLLLDPVYTGKAMAGLLDGVGRDRFDEGPIIFLHTGGAPALFAYNAAFQA